MILGPLRTLAIGLTGIFGKPTPATVAKPVAMEQAADAYRDIGIMLELEQDCVTENGGNYGVSQRQRAATPAELEKFWSDFGVHNAEHSARVHAELVAKEGR